MASGSVVEASSAARPVALILLWARERSVMWGAMVVAAILMALGSLRALESRWSEQRLALVSRAIAPLTPI
jgi:hypothetical protein